ncbi:MAG: hypothetical protein RL660_1021 [Bacteroidota bacterium]|jgi:tetratricopeptide (TPR) repeat protein
MSKKKHKPAVAPVQTAQETTSKTPTTEPIVPANQVPKLWSYIIALFSIAFLTFITNYDGSFAVDDYGIINENKITTNKVSVENTIDIFTTSHRHGLDGNMENELYRPFTKFIFNILYNAAGKNTTPYHILNVILYALSCVLLFVVLRRLFSGNNLIPFLASLLFAVHPIHCEAVANIKGLDDVLSLLFTLSTVYYALQNNDKPSAKYLTLAILSYTLAMFSKENSVLGILLVPLCLLFVNEKVFNIRLLAGMAVAAAIFLLCRHGALSQYNNAAVKVSLLDNIMYFANEGGSTNWSMRFGTAFYLQAFALFKLLWPTTLSCDYSFAGITPKTFANIEAWLGLFLFAGMIWLAFKAYKRSKWISFGLAWYLVAGLLTNNIFVVIGTAAADRLAYTPSIGICIAIIAALAHFLKVNISDGANDTLGAMFSKNKLLVSIAVLICIPLAVLSIKRNAEWQSDKLLFQADLAKYPETVKLQFAMAQKLSLTAPAFGISPDTVLADNLSAITYFNNATKRYARAVADDYYLWGRAYFNVHSVAASKYPRHLDSARQLFTKAIRGGYQRESGYTDLSQTYFFLYKQNNNRAMLDSALHYGHFALTKNPKEITINQNLGAIHGTIGTMDSAILYLQKAWKIDSTSASNILTANNLGQIYNMLGNANLSNEWFAKAKNLQQK